MIQKQIREQIEVLCEHAYSGNLNLNFVHLHANHLAELTRHLLATPESESDGPPGEAPLEVPTSGSTGSGSS
jgi:hypothetical protein